MAVSTDWLGLVSEEALEPQRPIIDPHHHLWDHPGHRYMLDELLADINSGHNIVATVFVECMAMYRADGPQELRSLGETEFVNGIAAQCASGLYGPVRAAAGIVGYADLALGHSVDAVLLAHIARAPDRFRGIRHASGFDPSPDVRNAHTNPPDGLLADPEFRKGFARLAPNGLSFDAWLYHHQIPELTALARAFPDTTIILDHFGGPLGIGPHEGRGAEIFEVWKRDVAELARCPNVVAKLGGLAMAVNGFNWHRRDAPPGSLELMEATKGYYLHAIEQFGPSRCMFESNFPVDKLSCSYGVLWNSFKRLVEDFSEAEKSALFFDTANRVYRLGL